MWEVVRVNVYDVAILLLVIGGMVALVLPAYLLYYKHKQQTKLLSEQINERSSNH